MNFVADAAAQYRMREALKSGKRVVRKVDEEWWAFGIRPYPLNYPNHAEALRAALAKEARR